MSVEIARLPQDETSYKKRFEKQFKPHTQAFEGVWVRTQDKKNKDLSGWRNPDDQRIRMIHFKDKYKVLEEKGEEFFSLYNPYVWTSISAPHEEIKERRERINDLLKKHDWVENADNYILAQEGSEFYFQLLQNVIARNANYSSLEALFYSKNIDFSKIHKHYPLGVLQAGIREQGEKQQPRESSNPSDILQYAPIQVELGSGPSIEAGVPPLRYLHGVYYVEDPDNGKFIFDPEKDRLLDDLIADPKEFYRKASYIYLSALKAEPTQFYLLLQKLYNLRTVVGPVITNNIDGLCNRLDLPTEFVREIAIKERGRAAKGEVIDFAFHPDARSLLVVGSHADRRGIRKAAREKGLQVIYIDPEEINKKPYALEELHPSDILFKMTAEEFATKFESQN